MGLCTRCNCAGDAKVARYGVQHSNAATAQTSRPTDASCMPRGDLSTDRRVVAWMLTCLQLFQDDAPAVLAPKREIRLPGDLIFRDTLYCSAFGMRLWVDATTILVGDQPTHICLDQQSSRSSNSHVRQKGLQQ